MSTSSLSRRWTVPLLATGLLTVIGTAAVLHFHGSHGHSHGDHNRAATLKLNGGKKWETDSPLRVGMERIRDLTAAMTSGGGATEREAFAKGVREQVDFLLRNCKLVPEADETLHVLISDMLEGADRVAKQNDSDGGLAMVRKALEIYPGYFDHPGWNAAGR